MIHVNDFNPIRRMPSGVLPNQSTGGANISGSNPTGPSLNASGRYANLNISNRVSISNPGTVNPHTPSFGYSSAFPQSQGNTHPMDDKAQPHFTYTNYYKFCCLKNVNCYFYQFSGVNGTTGANNNNTVANANSSSTTTATANTANNTGSNTNANSNPNISSNNNNANSSSSLYEVLRYEKLIKHKLKSDYQINDIITWIAKKELCIFQLQIDDPNKSFDPNVGFNQLKDAMSNIISENNLSLKLMSASTFDSGKIFESTLNGGNSTQTQLQKKSINVIYLSFLKAVHRFVLQKMSKSHLLFEASNQSLSIEIFPYSGQLITSSMIQKSIHNVPNLTDIHLGPKKKKVLKKLVPFSILKLSPSLNQKNELMVNITSLKKIFYRLTDYLTITCNSSIEELDKKSKFALYIAPSGIRCLIAGESYLDSITDIPPENHEKLFNVLKKFNDIDIVSNPSLINDKRLWIRIHPCGFSSSNSAPTIANYLDKTFNTGKKFIYWPLELCFIQLASDYTPGLELHESEEDKKLTLNDPFQIVEDFIDIIDELNLSTKQQNGTKVPSHDQANIEASSQSFKFPDGFTFNPEIEDLDHQLKPIPEPELDTLTEIMKTNKELDNIFNEREENIEIPEFDKQSDILFQKELNKVFNSTDPASSDEHPDLISKDDICSTNNKALEGNLEDDWDDLFGESMDENENVVENNVENNANIVLGIPTNVDADQSMDDAVDDAMESLENELETGNNKEFNERSSSAKPINSLTPLETQNLNTVDAKSSFNTSPFYQDPGAPSPIPFQIFAQEESPKNLETNTVKAKTPSMTPKEHKRSIFSPLNFNPLIQKDIDSKYSNGGKFFVKHSTDLLSGTQPDISTDEIKSSDVKDANVAISDRARKERQSISLTTPNFFLSELNKTHEHGLGIMAAALSDSDEDDGGEADDEVGIIMDQDGYGPSGTVQKYPGGGTIGNNVSRENTHESSFLDIVENNKVSSLLYDLADSIAFEDSGDIIADDSGDLLENVNNSPSESVCQRNTGNMGDDEFLLDDTVNGNLQTLKPKKPSTGLGLQFSGVEGNAVKRRKLESIFDNIAYNGDDDELDLDFDNNEDGGGGGDDDDDDDNLLQENLKTNLAKTQDLVVVVVEDNDMVQDNKLTDSSDKEGKRSQSAYNMGSMKLSSNTDVLNMLPASANQQEEQEERETIDIPNSWFFVLRLMAPIQIPFNFLKTSVIRIEKGKINELLAILQELVLYSQKDMKNPVLDMLIQNRECPSVLDADLEYLLYKIFPDVRKMKSFELLDSSVDSLQPKPFECLFGIYNTKPSINLSDRELKFYDEPNYNFSPTMNIPQLQNMESSKVAYTEERLDEEFQKLTVSDSMSQNLFRINPTVLNLKRHNQDLTVNKVALDFWKMMDLQPANGEKGFSVLFVIPKINLHFKSAALNFLNGVTYAYSTCKLGSIKYLGEAGICEVEAEGSNQQEYWASAKTSLLSIVGETQSFLNDEQNKLLLLLVDPFQNLESLISMADVAHTFEIVLSEKIVLDGNDSKRKKKKKNKSATKLSVDMFFKAISPDKFFTSNEGQKVVFTNQRYINLAFELYNLCPGFLKLKDRPNLFSIEKEIQNEVNFTVTKSSGKSVVDDEIFLHLCYERSVDKRWCVASWIDQSGKLNYTKTWYIGAGITGSESFEQVADEMMSVTMNYIKRMASKTYVILTRLSNIIPDDELAEWKRLSMKNNDVLLVVMTAELESSTMILTNNPGPMMTYKRKEENKDTVYTVASTNSQSQTPAHMMGAASNPPTNHQIGSVKFESPDVSMYTPSYDVGLSPLDSSMAHVPVPIQTLQPLYEEAENAISSPKNPIILDVADECYGLILQVPQPLANQPRIPLKTAFLVNTGEGITKNKVLELNLLSCQPGVSTTEFIKKLILQYRHLSSMALYFGMTGISRESGNVEFEEALDDDDDDDLHLEEKGIFSGANNNSNYVGGAFGNHSLDKKDRSKERQALHHQYVQLHRLQQRQKRQAQKDRDAEVEDNEDEAGVAPIHMLSVRKMIDFVVNIHVD